MKAFFGGVLGSVLLNAMFSSIASAAITFSFGPSSQQTFYANSGIQPVIMYANSSLLPGENASGFGSDLLLASPAKFNSPNAGTFGETGYVGNGNVLTGSSSFDRDTNPGSENIGYLNFTFQNLNGNIPNALTPLAKLLIDTTGLADGTYAISATNNSFGLANLADASGSFVILTAVPEPTSLLAGTTLGFFGVMYRRRRGSRPSSQPSAGPSSQPSSRSRRRRSRA